MKKVMVQFNIPGMTTKQYDQCWEEMRKTGHANPAGLIHHAAAQQGNNMVAVDVWESEEAFNNFGQALMPIFGRVGVVPVQPVVTPLHNEYSGIESGVTR
jgi:hypothetical protein